MHRLLAIFLLVLLPLQFSWAAVATYCEHETQSDGHPGHHEHRHHVDASGDTGPLADADADADQTPGAIDLDCGQCHGQCNVMPTLSATAPGTRATEPPGAFSAAASAVHAPSRPERPQWLRLA